MNHLAEQCPALFEIGNLKQSLCHTNGMPSLLRQSEGINDVRGDREILHDTPLHECASGTADEGLILYGERSNEEFPRANLWVIV